MAFRDDSGEIITSITHQDDELSHEEKQLAIYQRGILDMKEGSPERIAAQKRLDFYTKIGLPLQQQLDLPFVPGSPREAISAVRQEGFRRITDKRLDEISRLSTADKIGFYKHNTTWTDDKGNTLNAKQMEELGYIFGWNTKENKLIWKHQSTIEAEAYEKAEEKLYEEWKGKPGIFHLPEMVWTAWKSPTETFKYAISDDETYFKQVILPQRLYAGELLSAPKTPEALGKVAIYFADEPFTYRAAFGGLSKGLGWAAGKGGLWAKGAKTVTTGMLTYGASGIYTGAQEAMKEGDLAPYLAGVGSQFLFTMPMRGKTFRRGKTLGTRSKFRSKLTTPMERARYQDISKVMDISRGLRAKKIRLDLQSVQKLKNQPYQQSQLRKFAKTRLGKKAILGGSGAQATYTSKSGVPYKVSPGDLDVYFKPKWVRPKFSLIKKAFTIKIGKYKYTSKIKFPRKLKTEWHRPSRIPQVKKYFSEKKMNMSKYDLQDWHKPGSELAQYGAGHTLRPTRAAKGSIFKYQQRLSEQARRKAGSAQAPLHRFRGKDWGDITAIMEATPKKYPASLRARMAKWKPQTDPKTGQLTGPSYYKLHPAEAPTSKFTLIERVSRKYAKPVTSKDLFISESSKWVNPEAGPWRPQFIKETQLPSWAKGTTFWSGIPISPSSAVSASYTISARVGPSLLLASQKGYSTPKFKPKYPVTAITGYKYTPPSPKKKYPATYKKPDYIPAKPFKYVIPKKLLIPKTKITKRHKPYKAPEKEEKEPIFKKYRPIKKKGKGYRQREFKAFKPLKYMEKIK